MAKKTKAAREMTAGEKQVLDLWTEFRVLVEQVDAEVNKLAVKGNQSAGVRVRKGTRALRTLGVLVGKATLAAREETRLARLEHKKAVVAPDETPTDDGDEDETE